MNAVSLLEHFSDHGFIHQKMKKNTTSVRSYLNSVGDGESRNIALKRLNTLWTRLIRDPQYLKLYEEFIHEYEQLSHMKEVVVENDNSEIAYYMPHHGILRPEKSTTKLREHHYAFMANLKMMYQMMVIHESQQPLLRILWKESPEDPVKTFEM
ncbi:uncharacterized protein TNCV_2027531 [Trichonephila clavipes]|nr:uncharacterized protein TNCV_2027531 [Trichonephila clavipes]